MIIVHINPSGVEGVYFQSSSDLAEDLSMAIWPLVRKDLDGLDKKLRRAAKKTLDLLDMDAANERQADSSRF